MSDEGTHYYTKGVYFLHPYSLLLAILKHLCLSNFFSFQLLHADERL